MNDLEQLNEILNKRGITLSFSGYDASITFDSGESVTFIAHRDGAGNPYMEIEAHVKQQMDIDLHIGYY